MDTEGEEMAECNASSVIEYSDLCLGLDPPPDCYPGVKSNAGASALAMIFHTLNIFFGLSGNLLTLLSIPYARRQRRFGFQRANDSTTLYILNLAFCDLMSCGVSAPLFALQYVYRGWPIGKVMCILAVTIRWMLVFTGYLQLSLIAFSRVGKVFFSGPASKLPIVCMWVLGIVTVLPHNYRGVFGYDCRVGYCTMIRTDDKANRAMSYFIGFLLPFIMIVFSYTALWRMVRRSSNSLRDSSDHMRSQLSARDQRMAKMICSICLCYLICTLPVTSIKLVRGNDSNDIPYIRLFLSFMFWSQYSKTFLRIRREVVFRLDKEPTAFSTSNKPAVPRGSIHCKRHIRCFKTKSSSYSGVKSVRFESANSAPCPVMGPPSLDRTASLYTYPGARRHCRCRY